MLRRDGRRTRSLTAWGSALVASVLLAAAVPATSSAFTASITNSANSAASKARFTCADVFAGDTRSRSAFFEYTLLRSASERAGGTVAVDSSPQGNTGTYEGSRGADTAASRPCPADPGDPYVLDGASSRVISSKYFAPIRGDFSVEVWFKTTASSEKILGFEAQQSGVSGNYDKHLYVDDGGRLRFAIYNSDGNTTTPISQSRVDDGRWHQAVATSSSTAGCVLYVDGVQVDTNPKTVAENFGGYWRIGEGTTDGWPGAPQRSYFTGSLAFAGAYATVLTAADVRSAYDIGKPAAPDVAPSATPSASATPVATATATAVPEASATPTSTPSQAPVTTAPEPDETAILVSPTQEPAVSTTQDGRPTGGGN